MTETTKKAGTKELRDKSAGTRSQDTRQPWQDSWRGHLGQENRGRTPMAGKRRQDGQNITGQDRWNRTAETGHPWQDIHHRTVGRGHPRQVSRDRSAWQVGLKDKTRHVSLNRTQRTGQPEHDRKDRTAGTGQPGQHNCGRKARTGQPEHYIQSGKLRQVRDK